MQSRHSRVMFIHKGVILTLHGPIIAVFANAWYWSEPPTTGLLDISYVRYAFGSMSCLKFDTMGDFFEKYSVTILDHYQVSLVTRELPYKDNQEHKERLRDHYERKRQLSQNQKGLSSTSAKIHHVSHMREKIFDSDEEEQALAEMKQGQVISSPLTMRRMKTGVWILLVSSLVQFCGRSSDQTLCKIRIY